MLNSRWDENFFGKDLYLHLANKDARPWLCVNKVPLAMDLAKIKAGISKIDPPVGIKNWDSKPEGTHRKFKGSYPTTLVLFKVKNDLKSVQKVLRVFLGLLITSSFFHPISIIFWQIKGIAEHFMLSEKCFGKNENKCKNNENENLQLP